jgi:nitrite reductase (NADH) small subunit
VHVLGPAAAIPVGEGRVFSVDGRDVVVFRSRNGEVYGAAASCPHRGGPLADGLLGDHSVICPLHGFLFDLRTGEAPGRECERLVTYRVEVSGGGDLLLELR